MNTNCTKIHELFLLWTMWSINVQLSYGFILMHRCFGSLNYCQNVLYLETEVVVALHTWVSKKTCYTWSPRWRHGTLACIAICGATFGSKKERKKRNAVPRDGRHAQNVCAGGAHRESCPPPGPPSLQIFIRRPSLPRRDHQKTRAKSHRKARKKR